MNTMFNNNSPIINNMMGNGMYSNGYIPSNPIGNVVGIGNQGYNTINNMNMMGGMGGYYSNQYNNYYNPYLAQQQRQLQEAQMKEQMRQQTDILKSISRKVNNALGNNVDMEEHLKQYDPENYYQYNQQYSQYVQDEDERIHQQLMNVHCNGVNGNVYNVRLIQANNMIYEQEKKERPDDISMNEYHKSAGKMLNEIRMQEQRTMQRDLTKLYNVNQYNQLVKMHSNTNSYFNSMFNGTAMQRDMNIDDMEVKLPQHMVSTYDQRKKAFFDTIFGNK